MENQIKKMYSKDIAAIIFILIILWIILSVVMININYSVSDSFLRTVIISIGILVGLFSTASSIAVIIHLKKNQKILYENEI